MKNRFIHFSFLLAITAMIVLACNPKTAKTTQTDETPARTEPVTPPASKPEPLLIASFQKTACFGKCPVYTVKFFENGRATWHGKNNVERMGWYEAQADAATLKTIQDKARMAGYFDFENKYPVGQKVVDLPSTITYVRMGEQEKQVTNTHDAPEKLLEFEQYMLSLIEGLKWSAAADK